MGCVPVETYGSSFKAVWGLRRFKGSKVQACPAPPADGVQRFKPARLRQQTGVQWLKGKGFDVDP